MYKILEMSEEAIRRYFIALSLFGYKKYEDVDKLIVLLFIEELLSGEFSYFITDKDYKSIINTLYCLTGDTCMIDFPVFESYDTLIHSIKKDVIYRITEDSCLKSTEDDHFRIKS